MRCPSSLALAPCCSVFHCTQSSQYLDQDLMQGGHHEGEVQVAKVINVAQASSRM